MKKLFGIISNIASIVLVGPFSVYFSFLGLMFLVYSDPAESITKIFLVLGGGLFLCTPIFLIVGLILSVIFRKKGKYIESYLIQLLPFASVISGVFLMVVAIFFGDS